MSAHSDEDSHDGSSALIAAALGGTAVLLWLLRGQGTRWRRGTADAGTAARGQEPSPKRVVNIRVRAGDVVEVDDVALDLNAAVTAARAAGNARFSALGDARQG